MIRRSFFQYLFFVVLITMVVLALRFMNWIPMLVQTKSMRTYSTTHEIRTRLDIEEIYVPAYFPQRLSWPPFLILAQSKPFPAIVMEFRHGETQETVLVISQVAAGATLHLDEKIKIEEVKERVDYALKGRNARLVVGSCKEGDSCSQIAWREGEYRINITMKSTPFDIIKIAESMIRTP